MPVAGCVAALVIAGTVWQHGLPPAPHPVAAPALTRVDSTVATVIRRLQARRITCGRFRPLTPHSASCTLGPMTAPVAITSYPTHRAVVSALPALERAARSAFTARRQVTFLDAGATWVITGVWSRTALYEPAATSIDGTIAQQVSVILGGCLELLPRDAGSCAF